MSSWKDDDWKTVCAWVGAGVLGLVGLAFIIGILNTFDSGVWAHDRFTGAGRDAVIIRQDKYADPLYLCADGERRDPKNCRSAQEVVEWLRESYRHAEKQ